jgi:hypothetical protein
VKFLKEYQMKDIWNIRVIKHIARTIFISFECVFACVISVLGATRKIPFDLLANMLFKDLELVKWITFTFPCIIFASAIGMHKELLQPEENNKVLYKWPLYDEYKITTCIGLLYCLLPIIPTLFSALKFDKYEAYDVGFYYCLLMGISIISATSLYFAKFSIKRIIQELT